MTHLRLVKKLECLISKGSFTIIKLKTTDCYIWLYMDDKPLKMIHVYRNVNTEVHAR